jgi:ATP-dependent DNA ligase
VTLPVRPPVRPMLARLARTIPEGDYRYEPKWDGFRCLVFRSGDDVDLRSRNDRPFSRYFPELVAGFRALDRRSVVVDGEILVVAAGRFDFSALLARTHPAASRVERLAAETPARFVAFDLLAAGDSDLRDRPFDERRAMLEATMGSAAPPLFVTPATASAEAARSWLGLGAGGIDGVVAKQGSLRYQPGKRAMIKVKLDRTADCVVAGVRVFDDGAVASLLLALHDAEGTLRHVGVASSFPERRRRDLALELSPLVVPLEGHPWEHGFGLEGGPLGRLKGAAGRWTPDLERDWLPLRPERVCEVGYDAVEGWRFRHPARFRRWRPDREPASCTYDQLDAAALEDVDAALRAPR